MKKGGSRVSFTSNLDEWTAVLYYCSRTAYVYTSKCTLKKKGGVPCFIHLESLLPDNGNRIVEQAEGHGHHREEHAVRGEQRGQPRKLLRQHLSQPPVEGGRRLEDLRDRDSVVVVCCNGSLWYKKLCGVVG